MASLTDSAETCRTAGGGYRWDEMLKILVEARTSDMLHSA